MASEAATEAEYLEGKISVWWDIDSCPVGTGGFYVKPIAENIKAALFNFGYQGPVYISAYGDTTGISVAGVLSGIYLNHVPPGLNNNNSRELLLLELMYWALENPAPATILLICGGEENVFSDALHRLGKRGYNILLAVPNKAYPPLFAAVKTVWLCKSLLSGDSPYYWSSSGGVKATTEAECLAPTSVWWHIENCPIPKGWGLMAIAKNIKSALRNLNYTGPVSIFAYGRTDGESDQRSLASTGISLNSVPAGKSDTKMLLDMMIWALDNPAPANLLLISGDSVFSAALHYLVKSGYNILLAQPRAISCVTLAATAKTVWIWNDLFAGGSLVGSSGEVSSQMLNVSSSTASQGGEVPTPIRMKKYTEVEYLTANTSVWWDVDSCPIHDDWHGDIAENIRSGLSVLGYRGPVSISAFGYTDLIPYYFRSYFDDVGISLNPIASGEKVKRTVKSKYSTDKKMVVDMFGWALENAAPANVVLISANEGFCSALEALRDRGFNILLGTDIGRPSAPLVAVAKTAWVWPELLDGDPPSDFFFED